MTTHDQHAEPTAVDGTEQPTTTQSADHPVERPAERQDQATERIERSSERPPQPTASAEASATSDDRDLFADNELAGLRARWDNVQAGFVDDPKDCVQRADGLVSDVVEQLTMGFSQARSRLEEQWARGEEASTEDLRIALKRYREFFERLLAV
jgi:hypothetical protein